MQRNTKHRYRLAAETLEDKVLLAGDVTASVVEGTLLIRGDEASNGIVVTSGDAPGEYVVAGINAGERPTSVNGALGRVHLNGVRHGIGIGLGEGNDVANLFRINVRGHVAVSTGLGNDHVNIGGPRNDVGLANSHVRGSLVVDLGEGNDSLRVGGTSIGRGLEADAGVGDDYVGLVGNYVRGNIGINTGRGEDTVAIERTRATLARIGTGADGDRVAVVDSAFHGLAVNTDGGDDVVAIAGVRARSASFLGGNGDDTLNIRGRNHIGQLNVEGFETINGGGNGSIDLVFNGLGDAQPEEIKRLV